MKKGLVFFLAFSGAIFLSVYLLPPVFFPWAALVPAAGLPFALWKKRRAAGLILLGAALAFLWYFGYRAVLYSPAEELAGRRAEVTAVLAQYPEATDYGARGECYLLQPGRAPVKGLFYGPEVLLDLSPGDRLTAVGNCSLATTLRGEEVTYYTAKGVFLRITSPGAIHIQRAERTPIWCLPAVWARALRNGIRAAFPGEAGDLIAAIVTGDRSGLSEGLSLELARSGVSHIVAVSGMHICFLVGFLTYLTGWERKRRAAVCIPVVILFVLMVGGSPSVVRAAVMQLILLIAPLVEREADDPSSIAFALFFLLLLDPFSAASISLQLSFAAVVGIRLFTPRVSLLLFHLLPGGSGKGRRAVRAVLRVVWSSLATTLGAMVFTLPLSLLYFHTLSFAAPVVNVLILPVVSLLFALGLLLGLLAIALPGAAAVLGTLCAPLGWYVLGVVGGFAALPWSAVTLSDIYYPALVVGLYALLLIALLWRGERRRVRVFLAAGAAMTAAAFLFTGLSYGFSPLTVTVLDVGQGQSIVLTDRRRTALIDCGGNSFTNPGDVAADYLSDRGITTLDLLILTHFHADHANGLEALFRRMKVRAVAIPDSDNGSEYRELLFDLAKREGCEVRFVDADTVRTLGETRLTLFAPLGDGGANEEGLSVLATRGDFDLLITGDMTTVVEERLVEGHHLPDCEVLIVGHHGSRNATSDRLLDAVTPEAGFISVGYNSYGHPHPDTLGRLSDRGVSVYRTDRQGHITLRVGGS